MVITNKFPHIFGLEYACRGSQRGAFFRPISTFFRLCAHTTLKNVNANNNVSDNSVYLQCRRIRGNAEVRPPNVTATLWETGETWETSCLASFVYHKVQKESHLFNILAIVFTNL